VDFALVTNGLAKSSLLGAWIAGVVMVTHSVIEHYYPVLLPPDARPLVFVVGSGLTIAGGIGYAILRRQRW
jgi:hypothetical protein